MNKVRTVLVGCGGITGSWMSTAAMQEGIDLVAVVDLKREQAQQFCHKHAVDVPCFDNLAECLEQLQPAVVFDCTVPAAHESVTITALAAGCHVLGEKPMAADLAAGHRMVAAAQQYDRIYAVTQTRRFRPQQQAFANWLAQQPLGAIVGIEADFRIAANFGGFRAEMDHVLLLDMAIHHFDAARAMTGLSAVSAQCKEWNPPGSWYRHGACAAAQFELNNGAMLTYRGSWTAHGLQTSWNCSWLFECEGGVIRWDGEQAFSAERLVDPKQASAEAGGGLIRDIEAIDLPDFNAAPGRRMHDGAIADFLESLQQGRKPQSHAADNIHSLAMVFAAIESSKQQRRVHIDGTGQIQNQPQ